jgi:hypothetical protein
MRTQGIASKATITNKTRPAWLARTQEGRLAGPVFYVQYMSFLCVLTNTATSTMIDCGPIFKEILCKELSLTCT